MRKIVFIIDAAVIFSALAAYAFLGLAEHTSMQALRGQSIPPLSHLAYEYKSTIPIFAVIGVLGTLVKTIKGSLKESDVILYLALALLFINGILFTSLIAAMLTHVIFISPLR